MPKCTVSVAQRARRLAGGGGGGSVTATASDGGVLCSLFALAGRSWNALRFEEKAVSEMPRKAKHNPPLTSTHTTTVSLAALSSFRIALAVRRPPPDENRRAGFGEQTSQSGLCLHTQRCIVHTHSPERGCVVLSLNSTVFLSLTGPGTLLSTK